MLARLCKRIFRHVPIPERVCIIAAVLYACLPQHNLREELVNTHAVVKSRMADRY